MQDQTLTTWQRNLTVYWKQYENLNTDEIRYELTKLELKKWKECVEAIPRESDTGGSLRLYGDIKPIPDLEIYYCKHYVN